MPVNSWKTKDVNNLQEEIILFISIWCKKQKYPISQKEIVKEFEKKGKKMFTVAHALTRLQRRGYIRRTKIIGERGTCYVQLRSI